MSQLLRLLFLVAALTGTLALAAVPFTYVPLNDSDALCLDGSHYGYFVCKAGNDRWEINIQGGGWCYNETECLERASTPLGSSLTWPSQAAHMKYAPSPPSNAPPRLSLSCYTSLCHIFARFSCRCSHN
jgi:hypothetical protein